MAELIHPELSYQVLISSRADGAEHYNEFGKERIDSDGSGVQKTWPN